MMQATESAAIAATLDNETLLTRVRDVAGRYIGDPLHNNHDSVGLRDQFDLTIECTHASVFAFNDDGVCAAVSKLQNFTEPHWVRRAACVAVASMWTPKISMAAHELNA
jgi:hypothetical protein